MCRWAASFNSFNNQKRTHCRERTTMGKKGKRKSNKQRQKGGPRVGSTTDDASPPDAQVDHNNNASVEAAAYPPAPRPQRGFILPRKGICNVQDDVGRAVGAMVKYPWSCKDMLKYLPHTAQDIADGKLTAEEFTEAFKPVIDSIEPDSEYEKFADFMSIEAQRRQFINGIARPITIDALRPYRALYVPCGILNDEHGAGFLLPLVREMFGRILAAAAEDRVVASGFVEMVRNVVRGTCEEWAPRVDERFSNMMGRGFINICPLYICSVQQLDQIIKKEFDHLYRDLVFKDYQKHMIFSLQSALSNIVEYMCGKACWECETECHNLKKCSSCGLAKYCKSRSL